MAACYATKNATNYYTQMYWSAQMFLVYKPFHSFSHTYIPFLIFYSAATDHGKGGGQHGTGYSPQILDVIHIIL